MNNSTTTQQTQTKTSSWSPSPTSFWERLYANMFLSQYKRVEIDGVIKWQDKNNPNNVFDNKPSL